MGKVLLVFLGGGIGSVLRLGLVELARQWLPAGFPWGTLLVNALGGLAAGMVAAWLLGRPGGPAALFVMTGLLGGFTTFSAFSVEAVMLWQSGEPGRAAAYVAASVALALGGVLAGLAIGRRFWGIVAVAG